MLDTFKARLKAKTKAAGVNLSTKRIDAYADRLHKKNPDVKDDAEHDTLIDSLDELVSFADIAKQDDQVRTLDAKVKAQAAASTGKKEDDDDDDGKDDDDDDKTDQGKEKGKKDSGKEKSKDRTPSWANGLFERLDRIEGEKTKVSVKAKLKESLADIPESFYEEWSIPTKDEEIEAFENKVKTKWEAFTKDHPVQAEDKDKKKNGHQPNRSNTKPGTAASKEEIDAIMEKIK